MSLLDKLFLRKRAVVEMVINQLKNINWMNTPGIEAQSATFESNHKQVKAGV
jgi:hypothetical protein